MTVEEAQQRYEAAKREHAAAAEVESQTARAEQEALLALLDAEDRPATRLHREWIKAWLAGNHAECDRLLAFRYPESHRAQTKRDAELLAEIEAANGADHA